MLKSLFLIVGLMLVMGPGLALNVNAGAADEKLWGGQANNVGTIIGQKATDPRIITANIINVILGFLGILAVCLILFGGFKWMTAGGNETKVEEAKKLLISGVIGIIIILSAFSLAAYVINAIYKTTT